MSYASAEMQSMYSAAQADRAIGHKLCVCGGSYSSAEMQSVH